MTDLTISSAANPRLKAVVALRRRRVRDDQHLTVVDGFEEFALAVAAGVRAQTLYCCPELFSGPQVAAVVDAQRADGVPVVRLTRAVFEKVAYREGPDGILAVVPAPGGPLSDRPVVSGPAAGPASRPVGGPDAHLAAHPLVLLGQAVEKPGNLGAMLRTADATGVDLVIAADPVTDWGNPNVVRASKGTVFAVPCASTTTGEALNWLAAQGISLVATTPEAELEYSEVDLRGPVAIAVGTEKQGLTRQVLAAADHRVRIPMAGRADSLNVSVSAAVVLYEAVRQRRGDGQNLK